MCLTVPPLITKFTHCTISCFRNLLFYVGGSLLYVHEEKSNDTFRLSWSKPRQTDHCLYIKIGKNVWVIISSRRLNFDSSISQYYSVVFLLLNPKLCVPIKYKFCTFIITSPVIKTIMMRRLIDVKLISSNELTNRFLLLIDIKHVALKF